MDNKSIEKLVADLKAKVKEVEELYGALKTLQKYGAEINLPDIQNLFSTSGHEATIETNVSIRTDEFYQMTNSDATEKYLRKIGHAMPLDDIYNALVQGGIAFTRNGKIVLNTQLTRATRKFAKIGKGQTVSFGLLEWYLARRRKAVLGQILDGEPIRDVLQDDETPEDINEKAE